MHVLQCKHIKLNEKEAESFLKKHDIAKKQLPKIKKSDAFLKDVEVKEGDIIKIERKSFGNKTEYFRVVV
ncbi:hypothetical protein AUJ10_00185 [Candidatus Pacearchaeota archaeon CG1_02_31_27]|nr:MAG: hypothetical protein AUJ10_00185 [Candidatus Pacearchaeota archaeon CG1_02_31_27]PIN92233.1 MAG: DNA-directed RNA polymerase subunit H [Candidatus Pacearchaeota archaeon CG10_big_fil_rev_8_21_14_0_10_31_59]PIZ79846.1 MAG: DNA-directed RNA polymerase subunit H [Candidatus Pacearchaeota archaeon CG_4_10_14_0_2_um_filter_31_10]